MVEHVLTENACVLMAKKEPIVRLTHAFTPHAITMAFVRMEHATALNFTMENHAMFSSSTPTLQTIPAAIRAIPLFTITL